MATTTPNYLWVVPTSSDLVKNGATAIETLGDSVDASLWNSGFGQAGKNKIINGDFYINQRSFTSTTTSGAYTFDRWGAANSGGTSTYTARAFTAGAAPVAGYEGKNFIEIASTGQTLTSSFTQYNQRIENVRTLAGQPVTVSFWAKAASGTPKVAVDIQQNFGTTGSPSAGVNVYFGEATLTTGWVRYSFTTSLPSISGKTLTDDNTLIRLGLWTSAGTDFSARSINIGLQTATISFWGVQVEYGSVATPFQTATGSIGGELALAQRYYYRTAFTGRYGSGFAKTTSTTETLTNFPVQMRIAPTALEQSGTAADYLVTYLAAAAACSAVPAFSNCSAITAATTFTVAAATLIAGDGVNAGSNASTAYLGWSAEL